MVGFSPAKNRWSPRRASRISTFSFRSSTACCGGSTFCKSRGIFKEKKQMNMRLPRKAVHTYKHSSDGGKESRSIIEKNLVYAGTSYSIFWVDAAFRGVLVGQILENSTTFKQDKPIVIQGWHSMTWVQLYCTAMVGCELENRQRFRAFSIRRKNDIPSNTRPFEFHQQID